MPEPIYSLDYAAPGLERLSLTKGHTNGGPPDDSGHATHGDVVSVQHKPKDWLWATLTQNQRVTKEDWWQDVRSIELDVEDW